MGARTVGPLMVGGRWHSRRSRSSAVLALFALAAQGEDRAATAATLAPRRLPSAALVAKGHTLFLSSCASCHGLQAQGIPGRAPSLHGVGALAADFYLETGRMPLATPREEPMRTRPAFAQRRSGR